MGIIPALTRPNSCALRSGFSRPDAGYLNTRSYTTKSSISTHALRRNTKMGKINRKNPDRPKKRRNPRKIVKKPWTADDIARVAAFSKGSVHDQSGCEAQFQEALSQYGEVHCEPSASKRKLDWASSTPGGDQKLNQEEFATPDDKRFEFFSHKWILDLADFSTYLAEVTVCKSCHAPVEIVEEKNYRIGLGTRLHVRCTDSNCISRTMHRSFDTSKRTGNSYEINAFSRWRVEV